ncbi:MAG: hypothetical protein MK080_00285 [Opitutales bacterium]|nr:hypothetical protein [Opitutales bacterium]NRA27550.1 hypothetical protein [Opitutales bacterium]
MKKFIVDALVKPFFVILFFSGFGGSFVFVGHQTIEVLGEKNHEGLATFDYTQGHFWGLLKFPHRIEKVKKAEMGSKTVLQDGRYSSHSTVVFVSDKEKKIINKWE